MDSEGAGTRPVEPCGCAVARNVVFSKDFIDLELIITSSGTPLAQGVTSTDSCSGTFRKPLI